MHKAYGGNGRNQSKSPCRATSLIVLHNLRGGDKNISYDIHTAAAMQMAMRHLAGRKDCGRALLGSPHGRRTIS